MIEGLAIDVVDDAGRRMSVWIGSRAGTGWAYSDPTLNTGIGRAVSAEYPNYTGGPGPTASVPGGVPELMPFTTPAPAAPQQPTVPPKLTLHAASSRLRIGRAHSARVRLLASSGTLTVRATLRGTSITLARGTLRLRAGRAQTLRLKLGPRALRAVRRHGWSYRARLTLAATDGAGATTRLQRTFRLALS